MTNDDGLALGVIIRFLKGQKIINQNNFPDILSSAGQLSTDKVAAKLNLEKSNAKSVLEGKSNKNFDVISRYFYKVIVDNYDALPDFLKTGADKIYDLDIGRFEGDVESIFMKSVGQNINTMNEFSDKYAGFYYIWRYSAHLESDYAPYLKEEMLDEDQYGAWMIRSPMVIKPIQEGHRFPRFDINYKPKLGLEKQYSKVYGSVLRVGSPGHIYFIGHEPSIGYPLIMVAKNSFEVSSNFEGIVLRKHEADRVFKSRAIFQRVEGFDNIDDMECGIVKEDDVEEQISSFKSALLNKPNQTDKIGFRGGVIL